MEMLIDILVVMVIIICVLSIFTILKMLQLLKREEKNSREWDKNFDEEFESTKKRNEEFAEKISKDIEIKGFRNDE